MVMLGLEEYTLFCEWYGWYCAVSLFCEIVAKLDETRRSTT